MCDTLMERTLELLERTDQTLPQIYAATDISFYWLRRFKSRKIANPSVNTVQRLYEHLSGAPLLTK